MVEAKWLSSALYAMKPVCICCLICYLRVNSYVVWVLTLHGHMCVHCLMPGNKDLLCMHFFLCCTASYLHMTPRCSHRLPRCMIDTVYGLLHVCIMFGWYCGGCYRGNCVQGHFLVHVGSTMYTFCCCIHCVGICILAVMLCWCIAV